MLNGLIGGALGQLGGSAGQQNPLLQVAMQLIQGQHGGLTGLVQKFQNAGLGQQAASWVGTGENLPVSGDQVTQALGGDAIAGMAHRLGMDQGQVSGGLASLLPQVIDKLTPNGAIEQGSVGQVLSGLLEGFGR
jgi:uncharacterized protein YidB (DUF937 family)